MGHHFLYILYKFQNPNPDPIKTQFLIISLNIISCWGQEKNIADLSFRPSLLENIPCVQEVVTHIIM